MPRIFVTQLVPEPALVELRRLGEVDVNPDPERVLTRDELVAAVRTHDYLYCMVTNRVDAEVMDANPALRIIANMGVGYDNVDVAAASARRISVTNTPGVLTETTADLAWALLMAVARRVVEGDRLVREGRFRSWGPMMLLGDDVHGKTVGIVGFGRIGRAVARRAQGFAMQVIYSDAQQAPPELEAELRAGYLPLEDLLRRADFVSLHVTGGPSTYHLIGAPQLALMQPTAFLVNTSRGTVVDEAALVAALRAGQIAGAGLDVFEHEPALAPGLADLQNVVLTPHIASGSLATRTNMALTAAANVAAVIAGQRPPNLVNPEIYAGGV